MNRTWKQLSFASAYLLIFLLIVGGIYFFYLKPAPNCSDNKQNQEETGIDCGGPCIACEVKDLNLVTEEIIFLSAGEDRTTLLAKIRNPSQNFSASFSYQFELHGTPFQASELRGREVITAGDTEYIVIPNARVNGENIRSADLNISDLNWSEDKSLPPNIRIISQTNVSKTRVSVTGVLINQSPKSFPSVNVKALLFDSKGNIVNASFTQLEGVEAFSDKAFTVFFPEVKELISGVDSQRTEIYWDLNDKSL